MRKVEMFILNFFHLFSNWTFKNFSINNYTIATIGFCVAVVVGVLSIFDALESSRTIERVLINPKKYLLFLDMICAGIMLRFQNHIEKYFSGKYDLGDTGKLIDGLGVFIFILPVTLYVLAVYIGGKWWSSIDLILMSFSYMFVLCEPPSMEIRIAKAFKEKVK